MKKKSEDNLSAEIRTYGYRYSIKQAIIAFLFIILVSIALSYVYQLKMIYTTGVAVVGMLMVPALLGNSMKRKTDQKRFSDATIYMDQMLYAFLRKPIVKDALEDTIVMFPEDGQMRDTLERAWSAMDRDNISKNALAIIDEVYPNDRIKRMHDYFCKVEEIGKNYKSGIEVQIKDRKEWVEGICEYQLSIRKYKNRIYTAVVIVLLLCGMSTNIISKIPRLSLKISDIPVYEIVTALFMISELWICYKADKMLTINWLDQSRTKKYDMEEQYQRAVNYDEKREFKKSIMYAVIPGIIFLFCCYKVVLSGMIISFMVTVFMLFQHKIGHSLNMRLVRRELEKQFPVWLMEIVLRLQTENVSEAIKRSEDAAPAILKSPVHELVEEITENPESIDPYMNFLQDFPVPEIQEAMKRFYSMSATGVGDLDRQIVEIIERNNSLLRKSEKISHEDEEGGLFGMMLAPMLPAIFEFLVGLYALLIVFFSMPSSI